MPDEVITDLAQIQRDCVAKDDENIAFRTFVKLEVELSDRRLNTLVSETTAQVWQHIDCRTCANCCRSRYLAPDAETGKYITRELPCPFLDGNLCGIYEVRPGVCADYPHLQRNLRSRLWQVLDNATVCPIVYNVLERLKKSLGFVKP